MVRKKPTSWYVWDAALLSGFLLGAGWLIHDTVTTLARLDDPVSSGNVEEPRFNPIDRAWYRPAPPPFPQLAAEEKPDAGPPEKAPFISLKVTLKSVVYFVDQPRLSTASLTSDRDEDHVIVVSLGDCDPRRPALPCSVVEEDWKVTEISRRSVEITHVPSGEPLTYRLEYDDFTGYGAPDAGIVDPLLPPRTYW